MYNIQKYEIVQQCNYISKKKRTQTESYKWIAANVSPPKNDNYLTYMVN